MQRINILFVGDILAPLTGGADIDEQIEKYRNIDHNDKTTVKEIISSTIKRNFDLKSENYKQKAKQALAYGLKCDTIDFERVFNSKLLAFDPPENPRDFFLWIWQVLFNNEDLTFGDCQNYTDYIDYEEVYML